MCLPSVLRIPVGRADTLLRPYCECSQPAYVILAARLYGGGISWLVCNQTEPRTSHNSYTELTLY